MGDVIRPGFRTKLDLDPDQVLEAARGQLRFVIVIGKTHEGEEYLALSSSDGGDNVWNLERAKLALLRDADP